MHFIVGDAKAHHRIRNRMPAREHILDLLTRVDVPRRYLVVEELLLHLRLEPLALTHGLHDLKRARCVDAMLNQIIHNVVARTDNLVELGDFVDDERFRVAEPNVRAVRKPRDANQLLHRRRLRRVQHAAHKASAEFRRAERANLAVDGGKIDLERVARNVDAHRVRVVQRNGHGVETG